MEPAGLEFYTTRQLVQELMNRKTFLGLIVHSEDEYKERDWQGDKIFKIHLNANLGAEQASRLLSVLAERMQYNY